MLRAIWSKSLRGYRVPIMCWGFGLGLLMLIEVASATPAIRAAYASLAPSYRFLGEASNVQEPANYVTARLLEVFAPILFCIWPILAAANLVRGDEERGTMDVMLATPRSRARVILEKLSALIIALLLITLLLGLGILAGEPQVGGMQVDAGRAFLTALNVCLLAFFLAMVALLISQFTNSRGVAAGWASGLMVLAFFLDGTGRVVSGTWVQYLSPFYYYNLNRPLISDYNGSPAAALLLLGLGLLCALVSIVLFARRDSGRPVFTWQRNHSNGAQQRLIERGLRKAGRALSLRSITLRGLRSQGWASFWWLLGVALWCIWLTSIIPNIQSTLVKALAQTPELAKLFSGSNLATNAGFLSSLVFGFVVVLIAIFAMALALTWASDLENGRLELLLGTPRSRTRMLLERFSAVFLLTLLAPVLSWLLVVACAQAAHLSIDQGRVFAASASMFPPALIVVGLVYALAGRLRYGVVLGIVSLYIALAFLTDFLKALLNLPNWVLSLSIFHLYGSPASAGMDWGAFLVMTGVALVLLLIGLVQFRYVDIERG